MRSKILKNILENTTPEMTKKVEELSNAILVEKLEERNKELVKMLEKVLKINDHHNFNGHLVNDKITELLNKVKQ